MNWKQLKTVFLIALVLTAGKEGTARPVSIELPAIDIEGSFGGDRGPKRIPVGDGHAEEAAARAEAKRKAEEAKAEAKRKAEAAAAKAAAEAKAAEDAKKAADAAAAKAAADLAAARVAEAARIAAAEAAEKARKAEIEKLKIYVKEIAIDVGSEVATKLGGPVLWVIWEVGTRALDPADIGHHPMESGERLNPEKLKVLRQQLDIEAEKSRKDYERINPNQPFPASVRPLIPREKTMVAAASHVSSDAAAVTEVLLRYGSSENSTFGTAAVKQFVSETKLKYANACWNEKAQIARTIPYTSAGKLCESFDKNGKPTRKPGITAYREFAEVCEVKWGTCPLTVKEVVGAPCGCVGPSRPGYGTAAHSIPVAR